MLTLLSRIIKDQLGLAIFQTYRLNEKENQILWGWPGWDEVVSAEFGKKTHKQLKKKTYQG